MPDRNAPPDDRLLTQYVSGNLSREEEQDLLLKSFHDDTLFDALLAQGMLEKCSTDPNFRSAVAQHVKATQQAEQRRHRWFGAGAFALAAGIAGLGVFSLLPRNSQPPPAIQRSPAVHETARSTVTGKPTLDPAQGNERPILLAATLPPGKGEGALFRGQADSVRRPNSSGEISGVDGEEVTLTLGSVDGLIPGNRLRVVRAGVPVGTLEVTAVFRERSRARMNGEGAVRTGDQVLVAPVDYLNALWADLEAHLRKQEPEAAHRSASEAVQFAQSHDIQPSLKAAALSRLASLEMWAGKPEQAARAYRDASRLLTRSTANIEQYAIWEGLAIASLMAGNLDEAAHALREAERFAPGDPAAAARRLNNQAVLAEAKGDRETATQLYQQAFALPNASPANRASIEKNLNRLKQ